MPGSRGNYHLLPQFRQDDDSQTGIPVLKAGNMKAIRWAGGQVVRCQVGRWPDGEVARWPPGVQVVSGLEPTPPGTDLLRRMQVEPTYHQIREKLQTSIDVSRIQVGKSGGKKRS